MHQIDNFNKRKPQQSTPQSDSKMNNNMNTFSNSANNNSSSSMNPGPTIQNDQNSCFDAQGIFTGVTSQSTTVSKFYSMRNITQQSLQQLQNELTQTKHRLKVVSGKFSSTRKQRDQLKKQNKELQQQVLDLQSNIRQMVPGFSNTSSSFPMFNQLVNKASEFIKCDCQDAFFDLLCPELNMEGIVYFFTNTFTPIVDIIKQYFSPVTASLSKALQLGDIEGPIMNVLRKSYQNSWKNIYTSVFPNEVLHSIMQGVQNTLKLGNQTSKINNDIIDFLKKLAEVAFCLNISDPPLSFELSVIGNIVPFNPLKHQCVDGFVKNKQQCTIILPAVLKGITGSEECAVKAQVLPVDYDFP